MTSYRCADCREHTEHAYRLCDGCRKARCVASRASQGLPSTIESLYVLDRVIDIVDAAEAELTAGAA